MANNKPIDKTKKSNIKCEHCKYWDKGNYIQEQGYVGCSCMCIKNNIPKHYWNRCKEFEWAK